MLGLPSYGMHAFSQACLRPSSERDEGLLPAHYDPAAYGTQLYAANSAVSPGLSRYGAVPAWWQGQPYVQASDGCVPPLRDIGWLKAALESVMGGISDEQGWVPGQSPHMPLPPIPQRLFPQASIQVGDHDIGFLDPSGHGPQPQQLDAVVYLDPCLDPFNTGEPQRAPCCDLAARGMSCGCRGYSGPMSHHYPGGHRGGSNVGYGMVDSDWPGIDWRMGVGPGPFLTYPEVFAMQGRVNLQTCGPTPWQ
jgi:hypothetical protein